MWKKIFTCFLCCLLVAIPLVQRSFAAVTTITVVTVLILTLLTAMGITLVVADGSKESFLANKGDAFMSSKGYSGSFADWISGGTPMDITLKLGTLMVAKAVVDRCKEFINWLVPGASSDTVVDFSSGAATPISQAIFVGNIVSGAGGYANFRITGTFTPSVNYASELTDGTNTVHLTDRKITTTGRYSSSTGVYSPAGYNFAANSGAFIVLCLCPESFINRGNTCLPGIYFGQTITGSSAVQFASQSASNLDYVLQINEYTVTSGSSSASAIIGDYDDLSDLTTTTTEGTGGTTIINNTFYITQDGQALNPSGQSLDDIIDALRQALESDKREITVTGTTAATVAAGEAAPNYSDFQLGNLDLSGLGALLTTRFPFSIPWDLVRIFEVFVADPEPPHWSVDLLPISAFDGVDTTLDLDLGDYPIIGQVSRWFCIIDLCLGLVFATKKLIWTA